MVVWIERSNAVVRATTKTFIGIAVADIFTGRTYVSEYTSIERHSPTTYDDIERSYSVYSPSEVIIVSSVDDSIVSQIVQYTGMDERRIRVVNPILRTGETGMIRNAKNSRNKHTKLRPSIHSSAEMMMTDRRDALMPYDMRMNVYSFKHSFSC